MTLPDDDDDQKPHTVSFTEAVEEVVKKGLQEDRVTCGIGQCVQCLTSPEKIMLCLLAKLTGALPADVKIQLLLIKAFCQENNIDFLQVDNGVKMTQLLSAYLNQSKHVDSDVIKPSTVEKSAEFDCLMIRYPTQDTSFEEDFVSDHIKAEMKKGADPYVMLPDMTLTDTGKTLGIKTKKKICV